MNSKLRTAAATAAAAVALGVAAPMASAAEASRTPAVSSVQVGAVSKAADVNTITVALNKTTTGAHTTSLKKVDPEAKKIAKSIVSYIKKKMGKAYATAKAAAKKGIAAFKKWLETLSPTNPVRIVLSIPGNHLIQLVISFLR
ncbi:hypothetical protein [Streptomyces nigrescens]|uniref:Secreted protein n=1 Tax=Streptomyces nigrescens TaxID=1920 RepID=A0ABY7JCX9_STRNI|nr:hypothetical protein [Streptomyces nigrescens]WAU07849.1 hypothetical protein STRNI_006493 [Streptomyces nigrescens]